MIELRDIPIPPGWRAMSLAPGGDPRALVTEPALWQFEPHDTDPAWPALFMDALTMEAQKCGLELAFVEQIRDPWHTIPKMLERAALRARERLHELAVDRNEQRGTA